MKALVLAAALVLVPAQALTIREALEQGNQSLVNKTKSIPARLAPNIVKSFATVKEVAGIDLQLIITNTRAGGQTIPGYMFLDYGLEIMDELSRQYVIAHEFGHQRLGHSEARAALMEQLVTEDLMSNAGKVQLNVLEFQPALTKQSHEFEYAADVEGGLLLLRLGWTKAQILDCLQRYLQVEDSRTHPSTDKRYLNMRRKLPG